MNKIRTRRWVFTLNNPSQDLAQLVEELTSRVATRYIVVGREQAPTTGTLHYQGFVEFQNPATFKQVQGRLPGAHIEPAKGSNAQNKAYCTKSGDYVEKGELITRVQGSEQAYEVLTLITQGKDPITIALENPALASYIINHYNPLRAIYRDVKYRVLNDITYSRITDDDEE